MFAADLLSLCCVLWGWPRAQEPTTTAPDQALLRAAADLRRVAAAAAAQQFTFAGSCGFPTLDPSEPAVPFTIARSAVEAVETELTRRDEAKLKESQRIEQRSLDEIGARSSR